MKTHQEAARNNLQKQRLTDREVDKLYDIMDATDFLLNKHKIRYALEGGSLLGAVRNGGLIPHDNDADFDVLESDLQRVVDIEDEFRQFGLEVIVTPGWGLQIAHADSPGLQPGLWHDEWHSWTSKWPFLDLIAIEWDPAANRYSLAGDVAMHDYPDYYLSKSDWERPFERIQFGHLRLWTIGGQQARLAYLDRNYKDWDKKLEMLMDHRENVYFEQPIVCPIDKDKDFAYRPRSRAPSTLTKPIPYFIQ